MKILRFLLAVILFIFGFGFYKHNFDVNEYISYMSNDWAINFAQNFDISKSNTWLSFLYLDDVKPNNTDELEQQLQDIETLIKNSSSGSDEQISGDDFVNTWSDLGWSDSTSVWSGDNWLSESDSTDLSSGAASSFVETDVVVWSWYIDELTWNFDNTWDTVLPDLGSTWNTWKMSGNVSWKNSGDSMNFDENDFGDYFDSNTGVADLSSTQTWILADVSVNSWSMTTWSYDGVSSLSWSKSGQNDTALLSWGKDKTGSQVVTSQSTWFVILIWYDITKLTWQALLDFRLKQFLDSQNGK